MKKFKDFILEEVPPPDKPKSIRRPIDSSNIQRAKKAIEAGMPPSTAIKTHLKMFSNRKNPIHNELMGEKKRQKNRDPAFIKKIVKLHPKHTFAEIAAMHGLSRDVVSGLIKRHKPKVNNDSDR
jgi:hypothetical protein